MFISKATDISNAGGEDGRCAIFSCVQLCNPMDSSLPGSFFHEISQAKMLEWVAMQSIGKISKRSSWLRDWTHVFFCSCIAGRFFTAEPPGKTEVGPEGNKYHSPLNVSSRENSLHPIICRVQDAVHSLSTDASDPEGYITLSHT